jgi:hypothetical protein
MILGNRIHFAALVLSGAVLSAACFGIGTTIHILAGCATAFAIAWLVTQCHRGPAA